jgi:hypothetical protein
MRLGQLARKLALPPSEITEFLTSQQIAIADGANARLDENQVSIVLQRFAPGLLADQLQQEATEDVPPVAEEPIAETGVIVAETVSVAVTEIAEPAPDVDETGADEAEKGEQRSEVIKAPKVALSGLKVLGKIELPEKKKKAEDTPPIAAETQDASEVPPESPKKPEREQRRPDPRRRDRDQRDQRPKKNPIALAREREAREAEEKRKEELRLEKERRTQNYMKRVQAKAPTKAARLNREDVIDMSEVDLRPAPKTWLGKFWRWFRS